MKRACLLLLPALLLLTLAVGACNDESKPKITRLDASPTCGVAALEVEFTAFVSGGNETGDPLGGNNTLEVAWNFGDGSTSWSTIAYHTYQTPGEYTVTVTAKDPDGNIATATAPITVLADSLEIAAVSNFPEGNVSVTDTIQFDVTAVACNIDYPATLGDAVKMNYRWEMNDAVPDTFTGVAPRFTFTDPGEYDVLLAVTYPELAVTRHAALHFSVSP